MPVARLLVQSGPAPEAPPPASPRRPVTPNKKPPASDQSQKAWDNLRREVRAVAAAAGGTTLLLVIQGCLLQLLACCASNLGGCSTTRPAAAPAPCRHGPAAALAAPSDQPPRPRLPPLTRHPTQARKLESELDIKVAAYGKLCSSYEYGYSKGESGLATDQVGGSCWVGGWCVLAFAVCCSWPVEKLHRQLGKVAGLPGGTAARAECLSLATRRPGCRRAASPLLRRGQTGVAARSVDACTGDAQCDASSLVAHHLIFKLVRHPPSACNALLSWPAAAAGGQSRGNREAAGSAVGPQ